MFVSQGKKACANLIPPTFSLTAETDSENKAPKVCLQVILKKIKQKNEKS